MSRGHDRSTTMLAVAALVPLFGCAPTFHPGDPVRRTGDEIVVCGQFIHTGTPVVLWLDPGSYDAYRVENHFDYEKSPASAPASAAATSKADPPAEPRYGSWRKHVPADDLMRLKRDGWTLAELQKHVDLFVLHYDVCGTSRQCFKVLQDVRHLSVHFMLDLDGTIYQTLDLKERAWHASQANDRSVGVEIANIGAYPLVRESFLAPLSRSRPAGIPAELAKWYARDSAGRPYVTLPAWMGDGGIRTPNFVARPARSEPVIGEIHGHPYAQFDFTPQQYAALIKLTATLCRVLPRIKPDFPRDAAGHARMDELSTADYDAFHGILGHYHLTKQKQDPGPALDWDRLRTGVLRELRFCRAVTWARGCGCRPLDGARLSRAGRRCARGRR